LLGLRLRKDLWAPLAICLVWPLLIFSVDASGSFPVNDDWSFGPAVFQLINTGHYDRNGFWPMILIGQILWAAPFCLVLGKQYWVLRLSTEILGLAGVLAVYAILRFCGARPWLAFLGALTVMVNPLYLELSCSYMTDVPFFAAATLSFLACLHALRKPTAGAYLLVAVASVVATSIRQFGVLPPAAFAIADNLRPGRTGRRVLVSLLPLALAVATIVVYSLCKGPALSLPDEYEEATHALTPFFFQGKYAYCPYIFLHTLTYAFAFALPFYIAVPPWSACRRRLILLWTAGSFALTCQLAAWNMLVGSKGNALTTFGVGPCWMFARGFGLPSLPPAVWFAVTCAALIGSGWFFRICLSGARRLARFRLHLSERDRRFHFALSLCVLLQMTIFASVTLYDRYFLPFLPPLLVIAADRFRPREPSPRTALAAVVLCLFAWYSVAATHDYLEWNRQRWQLVRELTAKGVSPDDIALEPEFWATTMVRSVEGLPTLQYYRPATHRDYIDIAFAELPGGQVVAARSFQRWLVPGRAFVYAVRRLQLVPRTR